MTGKQKSLSSSCPVIGIFGHIDHGKTSLLDKIRQTSVAAREPGGITQNVSASQVILGKEYGDHAGFKITFIDTPGHAAFAKMRSRGAGIIDYAILVIAATEGVKPQTKESIKFIKQAKVPFLIAANKMDLAGANPDGLKTQLSQEEVFVEGRGGDVVVVPVSAKTGEGIKDLLEMLLLSLEMTPSPPRKKNSQFQGVIIDSQLDYRQGPRALILVKNGSFSPGDYLQAEQAQGKAKALLSPSGDRLLKASAGDPVTVLGFKSLPEIGASVILVNEIAGLNYQKSHASIDLNSEPEQAKQAKLLLFIKADSAASLEAVLANLPQDSDLQVVASGVGDFHERDVLLAQALGARLIGFKTNLSQKIKKLISTEGLSHDSYQIIYDLLDRAKEALKQAQKPHPQEQVLGEAKIIAEFGFDKQKIAGAKVTTGRIARGDRLHLKRGDKILGEARIKSLKHNKDDVDKAEIGEEFGVLLSPCLDFVMGDMLVSFRKLPTS